jgi:Mat/Ecp fimbriae outer membrane usher protein
MISVPARRTAVFVLALGAAAYASTELARDRTMAPSASTSSSITAAMQTEPDNGATPTVSADPASAAPATGSSSINGTRVQPERPGQNGNGFRYQSNGVPEGFEAWFEPQRVAIDIFYGGRYLITTLAEYTADTIRLLNPADVAARVPGVLDPVTLATALSDSMAVNSDKVCREPNQPLCGRLSPDSAGLIFDDTRLRADLFVNRDLLASIAEADPRYLPDGTSERVSLVQNLSALVAGDDAGNDSFSLFGKTRAGMNGHYGFADWVSTRDQDLSFDQLGYRHDLRDQIITAGLFETSLDMLRGMNQDLLLGAGIEKSMHRRTDLDSIIATPIDLFLPVRSRVDILRDGRLIASGFYEAGNQRVDTSRLPTGSYVIEVVTTDAAGNVSIQEQLFVKSTLLAPPGEAIWFAEAGKVMQRGTPDTFPDELDITLARGGYRWRQASWLGLGLAGAATEQAALGELSATMMFERLEAGGELYKSSAGGWGVGMRTIMRRGDHTISLNTRHSEADRLPPPDQPQYRLIDNDRWLYSAQLTSRLSTRASLSISSIVSGGDGFESTRRSNLRYSHFFSLPGNSLLTLTGDLGEVDGDARAAVGVQWRAFRGHWNHSAQIEIAASDIPADQDGVSAQVATRWRDLDILTDDLNAGLSAQVDRGGQGLTADVRHESEFGRGQAAVSHNRRDQFEQTQYLAGYDTSVVIGQRGLPAIGGGPRGNESAVILDLREGKGTVVDVYADGQRQFSARGGRRVPLTLPPYAEYQISLIDRGTQLVNFDAEPRRLVLYPGDVATLSWSMQRVNIIVGRLQRVQEFCSEVTEECYSLRLPMGDVRIEGLEGFVFTDADGFFQGDIAEGVGSLQARVGGDVCVIDISHLTAHEGVIRAPTLLCETSPSVAP